MCGRAEDLFTPKAVAALTRLFGPLGWEVAPRDEIRPTDQIRLIRPAGEEGYEAPFARWGLLPEQMDAAAVKKYSLFNARLESVERSKVFGPAFRTRRCIVPLSAFAEWPVAADGTKSNVRIARPDGLPLLAAGLWNRSEDGVESCTVVTRAPTADLEAVHGRMPALLLTADLPAWLRASPAEARRAAAASWKPGLLTVTSAERSATHLT
ncbi:SOS response-associated peptidase (plasmid) [Deinococcus sp. KNUC1210]|uniref:SOS response-associated peptidase n=1 Tax=Deinococcus sp. KNUC1210 TaxID=2917691 RepID=UPI001EF08D73|nr:SOS response-associated peptidase family protein [Deinococcus sp. KNUC1210]ULH18325.1 SOS response-associated peptidase [Deinococcus sp. KNUC1210]